MSNKTKKILLIGNGFDLRAGVKTTFREFFRFVIYGVILYNYSKSEVLKCLAKGESSDTQIDYEKYLDKEKIKNQVHVIADLQRKKESKNFEKKHPGEKLYPSKHPLEILLEIGEKESEEKKDETVFYYCRKLIETKFGKKFFYNILNCNDLEKALRINLTTESLRSDEDEHLQDWFVIYGLTNKKSKNQNTYIPDDTTLGQGIETIAHIIEANFNKTSNIELWSDVETVIEMLITQDMSDNLSLTKYGLSKANLPTWDHETIKDYCYGLELFEFLLAKYFNAITDKFDIEERFGSAYNFLEKIYNAHQNSMRMRYLTSSLQAPSMTPNDVLEFLKSPDLVINYNYTDVAKKIYEKLAKEKQGNKTNIRYIHINGEINHRFGIDPSKEGFETNIVIGYTNINKNTYTPKELYHFEKSCRRIVKNTEFFNLDYYIKDFDNFDLLIIGHSCCTADGDIIGDLLKHEKLKNAHILCHSKDALISVNNNIRHILRSEPTKYSELMTHINDKKNHNLFYAVEQSC